MSNRLTFSLASLIVLIALGLVFVGTPAKAATFADDAKIADISAIQGAAIDITLPKPTAAGDGDLTASLTDGTTTLSVVDSADPASTEGADGTLFDNLTLSFDDAGNVKLKGNVSPAVVSEVIVTYTIAEADDSSGTPASIENVSLKFAFEVRAQSNLLTFAGADIDNKDDLTVGTYFYEVLPAAQDGIGPLMYSIVNSTETAADSGIFTGGNIPAGMTFAESTRTLSGTPTGAADRAVVVYRVTDSTPTTALTRDIPFTVEVKARVNGPSFAIAKVPDAEYTKGTMKVKQGSEITDSLTLPVADTTNALGSVTYKLEGPDATASDPKLPTGLSFNAATRELSGTPTGDAGDTTLTYTATDTAENAKSINFKITVNAAVSVTAPENVTRILGASPSVDIAIAATLATGGTGTRTLTVDASTLPAGLTFANGKITGDPTAVTATGGSTVTITATDSLGAMKTANFKITVNKAPDITIESADLLKLIADRTYVANTPIQAEVLPKATGGVGDLSYALEGLPTGITFDSATRILRGTPTAASDAAMYTYVVTDDGDTAFLEPATPVVFAGDEDGYAVDHGATSVQDLFHVPLGGHLAAYGEVIDDHIHFPVAQNAGNVGGAVRRFNDDIGKIATDSVVGHAALYRDAQMGHVSKLNGVVGLGENRLGQVFAHLVAVNVESRHHLDVLDAIVSDAVVHHAGYRLVVGHLDIFVNALDQR